jgi:hypothetical protein
LFEKHALVLPTTLLQPDDVELPPSPRFPLQVRALGAWVGVAVAGCVISGARLCGEWMIQGGYTLRSDLLDGLGQS